MKNLVSAIQMVNVQKYMLDNHSHSTYILEHSLDNQLNQSLSPPLLLTHQNSSLNQPWFCSNSYRNQNASCNFISTFPFSCCSCIPIGMPFTLYITGKIERFLCLSKLYLLTVYNIHHLSMYMLVSFPLF